ncbi:MAG: CPXCG motif-containing cysteine-rich protein [Rhodothermaceae bacterium]|nr:CPXCG motif-containing cysteine-rich protein [Rhodothermaceae bacterium]
MTLHQIQEHEIGCPYCGEQIVLLIDPSVPSQSYIEDCEVCCRPIIITVSVQQEETIFVDVRQEDD